MSVKTSKLGQKVLAIFAAAAVISTGAFGVAGAAEGDAPAGPNTLKIHKLENPVFGTEAGTGAEIANPQESGAGGPIKNIMFKVTATSIAFNDARLGKELNTKEALLAAANGAKRSGPGDSTVVLTDKNGLATLSNLPNGVYLVEELDVDPANKPTINGTEVDVVTKAEPFVVILPLYVTNQWKTEVHAYPKNEVSFKSTKTLVDSSNALFADQFYTWEIKFRVPFPKTAGKQLEKLEVIDTFPEAVDVTTAEVVSVKSGETVIDGLTFTDGDTAQAKKIVFPADKLASVKSGDVVTIRVRAMVTKPGTIQNNFTFNHKYVDEEQPPTPPTTHDDTNESVTLVIKKKDSKNNKLLSGATFKVCNPAAAVPGDADANIAAGCRLVTDGSGDEDGNGVYKIVVRWAAGWTVEETQAPAGYVKSDEVINVTMTEEDKVDHLVDSEDLVVPNDPFDSSLIPSLPITGAAGQVLLTVAGIGILAMAAGTMFVAYRRRRNEN